MQRFAASRSITHDLGQWRKVPQCGRRYFYGTFGQRYNMWYGLSRRTILLTIILEPFPTPTAFRQGHACQSCQAANVVLSHSICPRVSRKKTLIIYGRSPTQPMTWAAWMVLCGPRALPIRWDITINGIFPITGGMRGIIPSAIAFFPL